MVLLRGISPNLARSIFQKSILLFPQDNTKNIQIRPLLCLESKSAFRYLRSLLYRGFLRLLLSPLMGDVAKLRKEQTTHNWGLNINMVPSKWPHHIRELNLVTWVIDCYIWLEKYNSWYMFSDHKVIFRSPANQHTMTRNWNTCTTWCIADERAKIENWSLVYSFLFKCFL